MQQPGVGSKPKDTEYKFTAPRAMKLPKYPSSEGMRIRFHDKEGNGRSSNIGGTHNSYTHRTIINDSFEE